ncbi:MAG TPA: MoaD/ThiS family protein [Streptosporangiaceae bacterium]|jgi:molybdopterin synthase sulfur carrier subunit|nr:MoaD/ThiS family protein [Streptosporangiaceae bacterium]
MATVTLRYWAAAKQAAGVAEETLSADTLGGALAAALRAREQAAASGQADRQAALRSVLARSSFLVDGNPVGGRAPEAVLLEDAAVVEVLPPFAGG